MNKTKGPKQITPTKLYELLKKGEHPLVIDTLPQYRYQQIHLPDAMHACVFEVTFLDQMSALTQDKSQGIVVYGDSKQTHDAKTAAGKLLRDGYSDISILEGGLSAWQAAGYPLHGDSIEAAESVEQQIADGIYLIDTEASVIEWAGRNPTTTHWGTLKLSDGEIRVENGQVTGHFVIDMQTIENINLAGDDLKQVLEGHLKSDDFFFVKLFPTATFEMTARPTAQLQQVSAPNFEVSGNLKLCGITAEQNFPATIVATDNERISAEAHFDVDRTRWGIIYGSTKYFKHLGMHLVFDLISLQLRMFTVPLKEKEKS